MNSIENIKRRFLLRAIFFILNTFVTAALPFMGKFVNLLGLLMLVPKTLSVPKYDLYQGNNISFLDCFMKEIKEARSKTNLYLLYHCVQVKGKSGRLEKKLWHWFNIVFFFSFLAVATTISAVRLIIDNVQTYSYFADA